MYLQQLFRYSKAWCFGIMLFFIAHGICLKYHSIKLEVIPIGLYDMFSAPSEMVPVLVLTQVKVNGKIVGPFDHPATRETLLYPYYAYKQRSQHPSTYTLITGRLRKLFPDLHLENVLYDPNKKMNVRMFMNRYKQYVSGLLDISVQQIEIIQRKIFLKQ